MIYCVVPRALAGELYDTLADYYRDEPNVLVIVDRRVRGARAARYPSGRERRRRRPIGSFPPLYPPSLRPSAGG